MKVNPHKSIFISGEIGRVGRQSRQSHRSGQHFLDFGGPAGPLLVPQARSLKYLGVVVSYQRFEDKALAHRLSSDSATRQRLTEVLHANTYLSLRRRLELYMACVRSTATYGLAVVGLSREGVQHLNAFQIRRIRSLAKSPVRNARESTSDLLQRVSQQRPVEAIMHQLQWSIKRRMLPQTSWQQDGLDRLQLLVASTQIESASHVAAEVACPTCGIYFWRPAGHENPSRKDAWTVLLLQQ